MKKFTASDAARALRAIPSETRTETSRENGKRGGRPGPSLEAQAAVVWTELASSTTRKMSLGAKLVALMLEQARESQIGLTPDSAARLVRERAGKRTSAWITRTARILG